jgi:hypothetical protein
MNKLALALILATGCYHANYKTGLPPGGAVHETKVHHYVFGLAGGGDIAVASLCPGGGVASVDEEKSFVDILLTGLTGALYSPTSVSVECAAGQQVH